MLLCDTCELAPASAGAERLTYLFERAVCALRSASNVLCTAASLKHTPNECEHKAANTRSCDRTFSAETLGCRQGELNEKRVYMLPPFPGVYDKPADGNPHHYEDRRLSCPCRNTNSGDTVRNKVFSNLVHASQCASFQKVSCLENLVVWDAPRS